MVLNQIILEGFGTLQITFPGYFAGIDKPWQIFFARISGISL